MAKLSIHLLGGFAVTIEDRPIKELNQARLQALLAYLTLHQDAPILRQKLAYTFWPESSDKQALNNLRTLLYRLRQNIPDSDHYLQLHRHTVQWRSDAPFDLDVTIFRNAIVLAQTSEEVGDRIALRTALEKAATLYGGDLLPTCYDKWIEPQRERLRQAYMGVMVKLLTLLEEDNAFAEAIKHTRRLLLENPLHEASYRRLMRLQVVNGDRIGALQTFQHCCDVLAESLGIDPSPKTLALHIGILQDEIGVGTDQREKQAQQVAHQQGKLDGHYDRLIKTNLLLLELQREKEEKTNLLSRLQQVTTGVPGLMELPRKVDDQGEKGSAVTVCPYKGLVAYGQADAAYFFGREKLIAEMAARLAGTSFLTIIGPSGSGKSSVVRAGLLPALAENAVPGSQAWITAVLTPGSHPLATLAIIGSQIIDVPAGKIYKKLQANQQGLYVALTQTLDEGVAATKFLLIIDQFEEIFALCRDETERRQFIDNLLWAVAETDGRLLVVLTIRADFYGRCAEYQNLAATLQDNLLVGPLNENGLRQVIERPAELVGLQLEPGLTDTILQDVVGEPGALPLLSHALLETWQRREGRYLTLGGYRATGGIRGAIAQTADTVYQKSTPQQQAITRNIFLRLTELGEEGAQDTRRRVAPTELMHQPEDEADVAAMLKTLADARLITTGEDTVEVAHEALIREWPLLRQWLEEDREGLRIHRHLTEAAQGWLNLARDPGELYRGARLAMATEYMAAHGSTLNLLEHEFLTASLALAQQREDEREARRQRELAAAQRLAAEEQAHAAEQAEAAKGLRRRASYLAVALVLAAVLAVVAIFLSQESNRNEQLAQGNAATAVAEAAQRSTAQAQAEIQQQEAERQHQLSVSRELAASSRINLNNDAELSILLAIQSLETAYSREAVNALHLALSYPIVEMTLAGHTNGVTDVVYTADGSRLVTGDRDGLVKIWDTNSGAELHTLSGHTADIAKFTFNADDTLLATASADSTARVWDLETGEELLILSDHIEWVTGIDFSPDGSRLATGDDGGQIRIWDLTTGEELLNLIGHTNFVNEVVYSPDGTQLISASYDGTIKFWDANNGQEQFTLTDHNDTVFGLAFSPDWALMATESLDNSIKLWDLSAIGEETDNQPLWTANRNAGGAGASNATRMTFTPDGQQILTLDADGNVSEWDVATGQLTRRIPCLTADEFTIAVSPDSTHLALSSESGIVNICSLLPTGELLAQSNDDQIYDVSFSPDGSKLYTAVASAGVKIWDFSDAQSGSFGKLINAFELAEEEANYNAVSSHDGTLLAITGANGTTKILDSRTWEELLTLPGHDHIISDVAFSQDDTRLATSSLDNTAKVWELLNGKELFTLDGHSDWVLEVVFNLDGDYLVTSSSDHTVRVWDANTGQELLTLDHGKTVHALAFSPDGQILVTGDRGVIHLWDFKGWVETGTMRELGQMVGHSDLIYAADFSPDGKHLATASNDQTARIWDVTTKQELFALLGNNDRVLDVAFSLDGSMLVTGGGDGTMRVYFLDPNDLLELAYTRLNRWFTPEECRQFLNSETCPPVPWEE